MKDARRRFVGMMVLCGVVGGGLLGVAGEISYNERFALGGDRVAALAELIPGTEDYYYYSALQLELEGKLADAKRMLNSGVKKFGHTGRLRELENRYHLKLYATHQAQSLGYLKRELNLHFNHQQKKLKPEVHLPTTLNQDIISFDAMARYAISESRNTARFEDSAFDYLVTASLTADQRRHLLARLRRPDYPGLVKLVIDDLNYKHSRGFWQHPVHKMLTLEQLEACLELKPDLIKQSNLVNTYLTKLQPGDDANWKADDAVYAAYLARLQAFADRLPAVHNSLKANILYKQLEFNVRKGVYDKALFDRYVKLPRPVHYINPKWLERKEHQHARVNMNASFAAYMALQPIRKDEQAVRRHLMHFLKDQPDFKAYEDTIEYNYLKRLFAEAKLINGIGDAEQWYAMMDSPTLVKALRDRIDIELLPTNPEYLEADAPVTLEVALKNIEALMIKVYEVNTTGYYRQNLTKITTAIELDGLVPNTGRSMDYTQPPMARHAESLTFPGITQPGVYVIELIGNGVSSRALVRKGRLTFTERIGSAGHAFTLFDDSGTVVEDAVLWMAGREYTAEDGEIHVPFSGRPAKQQVVFSGRGYSVLRDFQHLGETYALKAGMYLGREQLVAGKQCRVTIRPELLLNGEPIDLALLESPVLTVRSVDIDGHSAEEQINDFTLKNGEEATHTFRVPKRLRHLSIHLTGQVQNLNAGQKIDLAATRNFGANQINETVHVEDVFLRYTADGYSTELLGRNAEPRTGRAVQVQLKHRDFKRVMHVSLKSDGRGRCQLGALQDIDWVKVAGPEGTAHTWWLPRDRASHTPVLHALAGGALRVPLMAIGDHPLHQRVSLLEKRGGVFVKDCISHVTRRGGYLLISDLPAGDYSLMTKPNGHETIVRVTAGQQTRGQLLGRNRVLEKKATYPLQVQGIEIKDNAYRMTIANATPETRVHVYMTRYITDTLFGALGQPSFRSPAAAKLGRPKSQYLSGRRIGDEYRYVMERKHGVPYPGNMLTRPSLILNPWSPRTTTTGTDHARDGEAYASISADSAMSAYGGSAAAGAERLGSDQLSCFDFLNHVSPMALNLRPDRDGIVSLPVAELPHGQQLHVYAVNANSAVYRQRALDEVGETTKDLRLKRYLAPDAHFTEQKRTAILRKGERFTAADILSAKVEVIDSVGAAYRLLTALNDDPTLAEFNFIVNWPDHSPARKQELYKKYASHELHLFLSMKDPAFFKTVVRPYLANKKDKTFMDHRLLGEPLEAYLEPWRYGRLNMVERALLAQQLKKEHQSTARHLKDLYDLIPPNVERFNFLFDAAMRSSGLSGDDDMNVVLSEAAAAEGSLKGANGFLALKSKRSAPRPSVARAQFSVAGRADGKAMMERSRKLAAVAEMEVEEDFDASMDIEAPRMASKDRARRQARDAGKRQAVRQLYRKLEKTKEWVENNYYHKLIGEQLAGLVGIDAFWKAYANWDGKGGFLSGDLTEAGDSFSEMMMALAVLDLPFEAGKHDYQYKDGGLVLAAGSDVIVFHKQVQPAAGDATPSVLLINQSFFAQNDRYRHENNERFDKFVTKAFEKGRVYGCQLVLTNPTSTRRKVDVLQQIPAGAIAVMRGMQTRSRHAVLEAYSTQSQEYYFYFPLEGEYPHYPVHVAQHEEVVAAAEPFLFNVVSEVDELDKGSWEHVSQYGSEEDVFTYLNTHNINRLDMNLLAWRMRTQAFCDEVLALLADRKVYNQTLWSYSLYHDMPDRIREYLPHTPLANRSGLILASPLLELNPIIRHAYEHKEYWPLVNSRVYRLGRKRKILNAQFHAQYEHFMKALTYRRDLTDDDQMAVVIYLLLQDRIEEALATFDQVERKQLAMQIQYDYMAAYIAFYRERPADARKLALTYRDYPVDRWRHLFSDVLAQCDEISGKQAGVVDDENRTQTQTQLADTAPRLDVELESDRLALAHANVDRCTINYYPMDIELLFSRKPFVQDVGGQFTVIKPTHSEAVKLGADEQTEVKVPKALKDRNLMIEVTAAGVTRLKAYYPNALKVDLIESYGQLRVADKATGKALSKVYVKVYARTGRGAAMFYKDGYTDLRGRFDYTSLNTSEIDSVQRFAILVMSDTNGALVREAAPPKR
ncbi:MAG: hypothetical protein HN919_11070 [Verrucomicrobia bacterium]|nr:hypothetical protein [Verrucomicrobiota bacterium]MBT7066835.1 hypothetical protein [Verrucomicrobiota bacterium]MBT7701440.1 hypothetical protein [Verrucomicrobiota bacterium]